MALPLRSLKSLQITSGYAVYDDRGDVYVKLEQYKAALADYTKAIEVMPNSSHHNRRALAYFHLRQYVQALADIAKAVELNPEDSSNLFRISPSLVAKCPDKTFRDGILKLADKTIKLTNGSASAYFARARLLQAFGKHEPALADYNKAIKIDPKHANAYFNRGIFYHNLKKYDKALDDFDNAIEIDPKHAITYNNLAWLLATCPDSEFCDPIRAIQLAQKAVKLEPKSGSYSNTLGVAQYRAGNWPKTIDALKKSDQLYKGDQYSFNGFFLSMAHWQLGHKDEAQQYYQKSNEWMKKNTPKNRHWNKELTRFRAEAERLLGLPAEAKKPDAQKKKSGNSKTN